MSQSLQTENPSSSELKQATEFQQFQSEGDYEYLIRSTDVSLKNYFTLMNKTMHLLNADHEMNQMENIPIVCSYADMEFKMSPEIHHQWIKLMSTPKINMGYTRFDEYTKKILLQRLQNNVYPGCNSDNLTTVDSMLALYHLVITQLTTAEDQILIFTPTYYRFLFTLREEKRKVIEYKLQTVQNSDGLLNYAIDFQKLQNLFKTNKIKMMIFINPHNPAGKIWKRQEMQQLARLVKKYDCLVYSDDIFMECVYDPKQSYTSFLNFQDIHQNLIWAGSFGKAFNCSGNSFTYAIIPNKEIKAKLDHAILKASIYPKMCAVKMLQSCFTVGQNWRKNTILYIQQNHKILKDEINKRGLKLGLYTMQSGFLSVIDFGSYNLQHHQIKELLQSQNIFPTYFDVCYVNREVQSISSVRINLAMNKLLLIEFINRIQRALKSLK